MSKITNFLTRLSNRAFPNLDKAIYNSSNFPKYGLMADDMIRMDTEETKEAKSRLPPDVAAARQFRISRAINLNTNNQFLPKEEWMTMEKDVPYLRPIIRQVQEEQKEKLLYEAEFYSYKSGQDNEEC